MGALGISSSKGRPQLFNFKARLLLFSKKALRSHMLRSGALLPSLSNFSGCNAQLVMNY